MGLHDLDPEEEFENSLRPFRGTGFFNQNTLINKISANADKYKNLIESARKLEKANEQLPVDQRKHDKFVHDIVDAAATSRQNKALKR